MTPRLSPQAARMARARKDFVEAMARGCSISDLRAARAACSRRVEAVAPAEDIPEFHVAAEPAQHSPYWWMRD